MSVAYKTDYNSKLQQNNFAFPSRKIIFPYGGDNKNNTLTEKANSF